MIDSIIDIPHLNFSSWCQSSRWDQTALFWNHSRCLFSVPRFAYSRDFQGRLKCYYLHRCHFLIWWDFRAVLCHHLRKDFVVFSQAWMGCDHWCPRLIWEATLFQFLTVGDQFLILHSLTITHGFRIDQLNFLVFLPVAILGCHQGHIFQRHGLKLSNSLLLLWSENLFQRLRLTRNDDLWS